MTEISSTMFCPVCDMEVSLWDCFDGDEHVYEKVTCPKGHWGYEYDHGAFYEYVSAHEWRWQEDVSDEEWVTVTEAIDIAIEALRKELGYD